MSYFDIFHETKSDFTSEHLRKASEIMQKEYPNGAKVQSTAKPDREYSFNEISENIRTTLLDISKSLY